MVDRFQLNQWLQTTALFQGLSLDCLMPLTQIVQLQTWKKGEFIFSEGDEALGFFIVKNGRVKVFKIAPNGKEQILHIFSEGDYFAEVPTLDGKCFPAFAAALEPTELVFFPRVAFLEILHQHPPIAVNMLLIFSRHLRQLTNLVEELSLKEVPQRLAAYLLRLSDRLEGSTSVKLEVTKSQLAASLGTISATLSRALYRLSEEGLIAVNGSEIELLDRDRLQSLSQVLSGTRSDF